MKIVFKFSGEVAMRRMGSRGNASSKLESAIGIAPKRGMVLPFQPLAMSFDSVNYFVDMPAVRTSSSLILIDFIYTPLQ